MALVAVADKVLIGLPTAAPALASSGPWPAGPLPPAVTLAGSSHESTADSCGSVHRGLHCMLQSTGAPLSALAARATAPPVMLPSGLPSCSCVPEPGGVFLGQGSDFATPARPIFTTVQKPFNGIFKRPRLGIHSGRLHLRRQPHHMLTMRRTLLALAVALSAPRPAATFAPSLLRAAPRYGAAAHPRAARRVSSSPVLRMSGGGYVGDDKLKELGIVLPKVAAAAANYVPYIVSGNYVYVAGQIPVLDGEIKFKGTVPKDKTMDIAYQSARLCGLNIIAQVGRRSQLTRTSACSQRARCPAQCLCGRQLYMCTGKRD